MGVISGGEVQAIDRLREAVEKSDASMVALTDKIRRLNVWLVWLTLGIALMTAVQALVVLSMIGR